MTLGEDAALTSDTVIDTLKRVTAEIREDESHRLTAERRDHQDTRDALADQKERNREFFAGVIRRCRKKANRLTSIISVGLTGLLAVASAYSVLLSTGLPITNSVAIAGIVAFGVMGMMTVLNLVWGVTVKGLHDWLDRHLSGWFIRRESKFMSVDLLRELDLAETEEH